MQTAPWVLGIPHPTGFPLYILVGWLFGHVVAIGTVAWRMNVFSGVCLSVACCALCDIALVLDAPPIEAVLATLVFAWSTAVWNKANHADPHAMSIALILLAILFALKYAKNARARDLISACLFGGLGLATHPEAIFVLPVLIAAAIMRRPRIKTAGLSVLALAVPLSAYAYLPLRSAFVAAHGLDPLALPPVNGIEPGLLDTNHTRTWSGFITEISGSQFGAASALGAIFDFPVYPQAVAFWWRLAQPQMQNVEVFLAALGAGALIIRGKAALAFLIVMSLSVIPFVFRYSAVEGDVNRYLIPSFGFVAVFAAVASRLDVVGTTQLARSIICAMILTLAVIAQWHENSSTLNERLDTGGQPVIDAVAHLVPDGAIVVVNWVDAKSLGYGSAVEGTLGSRLIVAGWPGQFTSDYIRWSKSRPVYLYVDGSALSNAGASIPKSWLVPIPSADTYHHTIRIRPPTG